MLFSLNLVKKMILLLLTFLNSHFVKMMNFTLYNHWASPITPTLDSIIGSLYSQIKLFKTRQIHI